MHIQGFLTPEIVRPGRICWKDMAKVAVTEVETLQTPNLRNAADDPGS